MQLAVPDLPPRGMSSGIDKRVQLISIRFAAREVAPWRLGRVSQRA